MDAPEGWILCKDAMPADYGEDWVLVQIQERDGGYLWIPRVGEFRKRTNSWWVQDHDIWNMAEWPDFEVIAWRVIPEFDLEVSANDYTHKASQLRKEYEIVSMAPDEQRHDLQGLADLITAMTIRGATRDELDQVLEHSLVIIDATKYALDWKRSEIDHNISELAEKYLATPLSPEEHATIDMYYRLLGFMLNNK